MIEKIRQTIQRTMAFFHKQPLDRELNDEMTAHIAMATEENLRGGHVRRKRHGGGHWCVLAESSRRGRRIARHAVCRCWTLCCRICATRCARCGGTSALPSSQYSSSRWVVARNIVVFSRGEYDFAAPAAAFRDLRCFWCWIVEKEAKGVESAKHYRQDAPHRRLPAAETTLSQSVSGYFAFTQSQPFQTLQGTASQCLLRENAGRAGIF